MEGSSGKSGDKDGPKGARRRWPLRRLGSGRDAEARAKGADAESATTEIPATASERRAAAAAKQDVTTEIEQVKPRKAKSARAARGAKAKAPAKGSSAATAKPKAAARAPSKTASATAAKAAAKPAAAKAPAAKAKASSAKSKASRKRPKDPGWWFRISTRVRAGGYWLREKGQALARGLRPAGERVSDFWARRPAAQRIGIASGAVLVLLLLFVRFVPAPGIPCGISAVKECPPEQRSFALVPADALLYAHLTLDRDSEQYQRAADAFEQLSDLRTILTSQLPPALPAPSGTTVDVSADVLPWADRDLAVTLMPGPGESSLQAFVVGVGDREEADAFLAKIAPPGEPKQERVGDAEVSVYAGGFSSAFVEDSLVFGDEAAVRATLNAESGQAPALQGTPEEQAVRDQLPESRFAEVYLSRSGVQRLLAGRAGTSSQLETFVDYGATDGMAAAAVARDGGIQVNLVSSLNPKLVAKHPSFFAQLPQFEPSLADEAGSRTIGYVGLGDVGPTFAKLLKRSGGSGGGLAGALRGLSANLKTRAGVDPLTDLLPALGGQAALVAEPTDGVPFASLIVDGVDESEVSQTLAQLQKPVLQGIGTGGGSQVPKFEDTEVDGVTVHSVQASPTVNLSYAIFDGKLVISTDPAGVAQVRDSAGGLADAEAYERATGELPDRVSALVFLNLDELFGQVTRTNLVEDPFFANLSVLFDKATSVGLAVNGEEDQIRSEMFLAID